MFDIVDCEADPAKYGFTKFFNSSACRGRAVEAENLRAAAEYRSRKALILLKDFAFDEGAIKLIAEKKTACFLIDLGRLIRAHGVPRAIMISKLRSFLALCNKYGAFYAFATFSGKEDAVRSARELESIIMLLGLSRGQAAFALKMLPHYL